MQNHYLVDNKRFLIEKKRWDRIVDIIERNGSITIDDIVRELNVSPATARRDLRQMHSVGLLSRIRGGAVSPVQVGFARPLDESKSIAVREKKAIGRYAASLIRPGDTVILDGGTTTCQVAAHITAPNVTVVTNSQTVIAALQNNPNVVVIVIGGLLARNYGITVGPDAIRMLRQLRADIAIMGVTAISAAEGITGPDRFATEMKAVVAEQCRELIVVADHTKLGAHSLFEVAPIESVHKLITDSLATKEQITAFIDAGIDVTVLPMDGDDSSHTEA